MKRHEGFLFLTLIVSGAVAACGSSSDDGPSVFDSGGGGNGVDGSFPDASGDDGSTGSGDDSGRFALGDSGTTGTTDVDAGDVASLYFSPASWTVTVDGTTVPTQNFSLYAKLKSGGPDTLVDATSLAFNRPDLATLTEGNPAILKADGLLAGTGTLQATFAGQSTTAAVSISVAIKQTIGTLPTGAQGGLDGLPVTTPGTTTTTTADGGAGTGDGGTTTTTTPAVPPTPTDPTLKTILYPYDQTVFPLGIDSPLLMWNGPNANDAFKLHVEEANYTFDLYTTAAAAAQVQFPQDVWDRLTASNTGDPVIFTVSRWDVPTQKAYVSVNESWKVAPESLRGAIYYWAIDANGTTTGGNGHLARIRPGTGATPEVIGGGTCIGCHAVSSDGTTLVGSLSNMDVSQSAAGPNQSVDQADFDKRAWATYTLGSGALPTTPSYQSKQFGGNIAVNNNGEYIVFGDEELHLSKTADGTAITTSGIEALSYSGTANTGWMDPAFSPAGTKLAVIKGGTEHKPGSTPFCTTAQQSSGNCNNYLDNYYENITGGAITVVDFNSATTTFSGARSLVPQSALPTGPTPTTGGTPPTTASNTQQYLSYPSFAPDNDTLAFQVSDWPDGCHDDCGPLTTEAGSVYLTHDNMTALQRLTNLSDPPLAADKNLTFEPTFHPLERGGYFWVVVSSARSWGNELPGGTANQNKKLWVAAIDPSGTGDVSHPAFYLQSQEKTYGTGTDPSINMRGFWSQASCTATVIPASGSGADAGADSGAGAAACTAGFECCSGFCENSVCVDKGSVSCIAVGGACTATSECCSNASVSCTSNKCAANPIR